MSAGIPTSSNPLFDPIAVSSESKPPLSEVSRPSKDPLSATVLHTPRMAAPISADIQLLRDMEAEILDIEDKVLLLLNAPTLTRPEEIQLEKMIAKRSQLGKQKDEMLKTTYVGPPIIATSPTSLSRRT